jgi:hypothetical protein
MRTQNKSYYHFKVCSGVGEYTYYRTASDITKFFGIPKSSIYNKIQGGSSQVGKWKTLIIESCRLPIFEEIQINY